jgi:7,8-dihydroneopterin aldolase/epimerase/oxygenase
MITIQVHKVLLHAFHGIYPEERLLGNTFEINLDVIYEEGDNEFDNIASTIDYTRLYEIIKSRMRTPTALLEKLAKDIIDEVKNQFPFVCEISISIYKLNMPIENFQGKIGVRLEKKF